MERVVVNKLEQGKRATTDLQMGLYYLLCSLSAPFLLSELKHLAWKRKVLEEIVRMFDTFWKA